MPHRYVWGGIDRTCSGDKEKEKIKEDPEALNVISMLPGFLLYESWQKKAGKERNKFDAYSMIILQFIISWKQPAPSSY